jgi:hypothetical protein
MRIGTLFISLAAIAVVATGCSSKEEPARAAVASTEAALNGVRDDASRYAPEQLQAVEAKVEGLKTSLVKEEYKEVIAAAPNVTKEITALRDVVVARQTQNAAATNEWEALKEEVPRLVQSIQVRVDSLTGSKLPKEVTKEDFEAAKTDLENMKTQWSEATAAFGAGDATQAADKGRAVKAKAEELMGTLAIPAV